MSARIQESSPQVSIFGSAYRVIFPKENHVHYVEKNKQCSCGKQECRAITAVAVYLKNGGERAPDLLTRCPVCGANISWDPLWNNHVTREAGWRCMSGGLLHFLMVRTHRIQGNFARNPWLIPPVKQQGVIVYPGLRRDELFSWQECTEIRRKVFEDTGYDPSA